MLELWTIIARWRFYLWIEYFHVLQVARILNGDGGGFSVWKKFHKIPAFKLGSSVDVSADPDVDCTWPSKMSSTQQVGNSSGVCIWWGLLPKVDHNCTWMSWNGWTEKCEVPETAILASTKKKCDWYTCPTAILMKSK